MKRLELLVKQIDPRNFSELVDLYVFGCKNTRWRRFLRRLLYGQDRYLNLTSAVRILRAIIRQLPANTIYVYYLDCLAIQDIPAILALAIDICQRRKIQLKKSDLEPEWYQRKKELNVGSLREH
jgi:hypothetical protein